MIDRCRTGVPLVAKKETDMNSNGHIRARRLARGLSPLGAALGLALLSAFAGKAPRVLPPNPGPEVGTTTTTPASTTPSGPVPGSEGIFRRC